MSIAEASLDVPRSPRRRHAAVAGLVGGPYPNLRASASRRPFLTAAPTSDRTLVRLSTAARTLPAGGPYPNLTTRR